MNDYMWIVHEPDLNGLGRDEFAVFESERAAQDYVERNMDEGQWVTGSYGECWEEYESEEVTALVIKARVLG